MELLIKYLFNYIGTSLVMVFSVNCWESCLQNYDKPDKLPKVIFLIIATLIISIVNIHISQPLRVIIVYIFMNIFCLLYIKKGIIKTTFLVIISELIITISETVFIIIISIFIGDKVNSIATMPSFYVLINAVVAIISALVSKTGVHKKLFNFFIKATKSIKMNETLINSAMIMFVIVITLIESYMNLPIFIVLITNTLMGILFIAITIKSSIIKSKYNRINNKYQTSITSLKEYETMIDKFRVNTHENKNELLTIRNMIKNNDKNIVEYIDKLVDNKIKDNEKIMYQTSKIPEGGLRATIYSKLCVMDKYKIKYKLDISKDVRTVDLINLDEELILNICKILGVFLDNAIEETKNLKKKEVNVELYVIENKLYIDITNNFKGNIDLNKIGYEKNTTKGEEHGYGLLLVNKVVRENSKYLENKKSINGNYFTQTLKIKIK